MNKIGIIYFSGTGNTKFVAQTIKEELEKYNKDSDLISIEQDNVNLNKYESLIIGGPVYVERYPEILLEYMHKNLKEYKSDLTCDDITEDFLNCYLHYLKKIRGMQDNTAYKKMGFAAEDYPIAVQHYNSEVTLPLYNAMTLKEQEYLVEKFKKCFWYKDTK